MRIETLEDAAYVLNHCKWRGREDWKVWLGGLLSKAGESIRIEQPEAMCVAHCNNRMTDADIRAMLQEKRDTEQLCIMCGKPVEETRRIYEHPTCHACLHPPDVHINLAQQIGPMLWLE